MQILKAIINMLSMLKNRTCEYDWERQKWHKTERPKLNFWRWETQYSKWKIHWAGLIADHILDVFYDRFNNTEEKMGKPEDIAMETVHGNLFGNSFYITVSITCSHKPGFIWLCGRWKPQDKIQWLKVEWNLPWPWLWRG